MMFHKKRQTNIGRYLAANNGKRSRDPHFIQSENGFDGCISAFPEPVNTNKKKILLRLQLPAVYQFINLDRVRVHGAEARFEGRASSGLFATLALSYAKGNQIDPDGVRTPLSTIDPVKLVAGVGYRELAGRFGGQIIMTHAGRKEASRAAGVCSSECFRPDAFTILDATAFVRIGGGLTLRGGIFNILDKKYSWWSDVRGLALVPLSTPDPALPGLLVPPASADAYTQPGRNASVSLSYRF